MPDKSSSSNQSQNGGDDHAYEVLARKYRPRRFEDLIGHDVMVRTLENAFAAGRIAHAYILTGVRGVGKTTTARILARALNYMPVDGDDQGPQMRMEEDGRHCQAIAQSRHPDVIEMDAASRTGVGDIRELIEAVRYAPIEARYKVYIIDEVHMLSTAAFNALLKTLEEPPPHVKFIFATTEIRKLPITVLSRCQRFDLRRIEPETMIAHLQKIAKAEGVEIETEGYGMIARAAEGSARDALSILDQAIVQHGIVGKGGKTKPISVHTIRDMLGLADRSLTWNLIEACFEGEAGSALAEFRRQYDGGADPVVILRDIMELVHLLTRVKAAGENAAHHGPAGEADSAKAIALSEKLSMNGLTRAWSLLMKGLDETRMAPDPLASGEMAIIRLCYASTLPTPDEALRLVKKMQEQSGEGAGNAAPGNGGTRAYIANPSPESKNTQIAENTIAFKPRAVLNTQSDTKNQSGGAIAQKKAQTKEPLFHSLEDIAKHAGRMKDVRLRTEVESFLHLVSFEQRRITVRLSKDAPQNLVERLIRALKAWTGEQWIVVIAETEQGDRTLRTIRHDEVVSHPLIKRALELFPGARVDKIREPEIYDEKDSAFDVDSDSANIIIEDREAN